MNNRDGILKMIVARAGLTLVDLFIKKLSVNVSTSQILITFGFCSSLVFAGITMVNGYNVFARFVWTRITIMRAIAEAIAAVFFVISLAEVPLSTVAAALQLNLITTAWVYSFT